MENNSTNKQTKPNKKGKKDKILSRTWTLHLRLDAIIRYHNTLFITTPQGLITLPWGKVCSWMLFPYNFRWQTAFKDDQATLTELSRVKTQCKFHCNNSMKWHNNYALQNADTCPRLQSRMQNVCFDISISAVILKLMVKITSISSSYTFLRIAWHDIF